MSNDRIEREREKLYKAINEYGLDSKEVRRISTRLDKLINKHYEHDVEYPEYSDMKANYQECIAVLKTTLQETGTFPTVKEWNRYAFTHNLLCSISIEHIAKMNWSKLEKHINNEVK